MQLIGSEDMEDNFYMTKSDSEKDFEHRRSELEKLLNLKLEKADKNEAGVDYYTTDNKFGIELSVVSFRDIEEKTLSEMKDNEFKYMKDDDIIYDDKIASEIDPIVKKVLIISYINNKNKIKNKIEKEMGHFSFGRGKSNFEYALIVLNCKYFMYESLFSDCENVLKDIGLYHQSLIGVVISYLKNTTDERQSLTPNVLIKNPHCDYQPFQITDKPETYFKSIPTRILFDFWENISSFDASKPIDNIKKFMIRNKYMDENINTTLHGSVIIMPKKSHIKLDKITLNDKEIPYKKFEKPR